jgi:transcriptional regulator with XRE-family HTH domain
LNRTYISSLERGLRVHTITTLFKVSATLAIRPEAFITLMQVEDGNRRPEGQ